MDNLKDNWSKRDYRQKAKSFLRENNDFSRDQARTEWDSRILALRNNTNLKGKDLRRQAYMNILNSQTQMPELDSNIEIQDDVLPDITFAQPEILQNTPVIAKRIEYKPQYKTFREAFAAARKAGLKEFEWKGKSYKTNIANNNPSEPHKVKRQGKSYNTNIANNNPTIPEVPIDIADSNVEVQDDFTTLSPNWYGPFLKPVFFNKNPQIGWPMPIKGENVVTDYFWRFF